ncbi:MAG: class I SAM-dependent methyltransferase [Phycisphaerales bacterium]|jgi:SAM-dependent methyltransferase|nr:class I SAM-dependent methyltransferase [Phycisphaerales bacterium]
MSRYRAIAEYYDAEYADSAMLKEDVPFFLGHLPGKRQQVLELAAGTGRASIPIAQAGHRVVGVDVDRSMLSICKRKCDAVGLGASKVELIRRDILKLDLGRRFDWVCLFFNTFLNFTTLERQYALLRVVGKHLKPRGRFWIDIFQPDLHLLARERSVDLAPTIFYVPALDRTVMRTTEIQSNPTRQSQNVIFHYRWIDQAGHERHEETRFELTYVFPRELRILLERNGLKIERLYGDYDGSKLSADSPRMIALCALA